MRGGKVSDPSVQRRINGGLEGRTDGEAAVLQPAIVEGVPLRILDNIRFHVSDWLRWRGALALGAGHLDPELATLLRRDQDELRGGVAV